MKPVYQVKQDVYFDRYSLDGKLTDVIAALQKTLESVPEEFRNDVTMDVSTDNFYDSCSVEVEVFYQRPETESEAKARQDREAQYAQQVCERDRAQYEALKRRFG